MAEKKTASNSGVPSSIEQPIMGAISSIPSERVHTWASAFFHPMETYSSKKAQASWGGIAIHLALAGLVSWLASMLATIISGDFGSAMVLSAGIIVIPIFMVISGMIGSVLYFIAAKIFGGKGALMGQTFIFALLTGGYSIMLFPFTVLGGLPVIGVLFSLLGLFVVLYCIYSYYRAIKGIHQVSSLRAIAILLLPIILAVLIGFFVGAYFALNSIGTMIPV